MKKCIVVFAQFFILMTLTACQEQQDQASFKENARKYGFATSYDPLEQHKITASKNGCRVNFYEFDSTEEAQNKYERFLSEAFAIEQKIRSNQKEKINFFFYNHYSLKTATQYFYATQYFNTVLYFKGARDCEHNLEKFFDTLSY